MFHEILAGRIYATNDSTLSTGSGFTNSVIQLDTISFTTVSPYLLQGKVVPLHVWFHLIFNILSQRH